MNGPVIQTSLGRSFAIQRRVIGAVLLREIITRYGRRNIGVLWLVVEPMLFTLGVTGLWIAARMHTVSDVPIVAFAVTGYSSVLIWRNASNRCALAVAPNVGLLYHRNVKVIDLFLARVILEVIGATASFVMLTLFFAALGFMKLPSDLAPVVGGWLLLCWFGFALGLVVGSLSESFDTFERVWHVITYLLFPLSGALFMVHWLPHPMQESVLWIPMLHGVEMIRHGFFGSVTPAYYNAGYLAFCDLALTLIGLALVRYSSRRMHPE